MALLYRCTRDGTEYEVRSHGATRRLFSDGVFHSAWNPRTGLTGRTWDLLLAAAFALEKPARRILVLGVGAGTVLLQYRRFLDPGLLVGIDLNPVHLRIGRRYFGLDGAGAELFEADAKDWVSQWQGPPFDLVVEDLYGHCAGEPQRAVPVTAGWVAALSGLVAPGGALVVNFTSLPELRASAPLQEARARAPFSSAFMLRGPSDENAIAAFCRARTTPAAVRARARRVRGLDDRKPGCRLRYTIRTLW